MRIGHRVKEQVRCQEGVPFCPRNSLERHKNTQNSPIQLLKAPPTLNKSDTCITENTMMAIRKPELVPASLAPSPAQHAGPTLVPGTNTRRSALNNWESQSRPSSRAEPDHLAASTPMPFSERLQNRSSALNRSTVPATQKNLTARRPLPKRSRAKWNTRPLICQSLNHSKQHLAR